MLKIQNDGHFFINYRHLFGVKLNRFAIISLDSPMLKIELTGDSRLAGELLPRVHQAKFGIRIKASNLIDLTGIHGLLEPHFKEEKTLTYLIKKGINI